VDAALAELPKRLDMHLQKILDELNPKQQTLPRPQPRGWDD
jgi:hypothetical protein